MLSLLRHTLTHIHTRLYCIFPNCLARCSIFNKNSHHILIPGTTNQCIETQESVDSAPALAYLDQYSGFTASFTAGEQKQHISRSDLLTILEAGILGRRLHLESIHPIVPFVVDPVTTS